MQVFAESKREEYEEEKDRKERKESRFKGYLYISLRAPPPSLFPCHSLNRQHIKTLMLFADLDLPTQ